MQRDVAALLDGGIAGCIGTATMSAVMMAARKAGLLGRQPPELIVEKALTAVGVHRHETTQDALAVAMHFGFGASMGALFGLSRGRSRLPLGPAFSGLLFGSLVWAVSYKGWLPGLSIMPQPEYDKPGRPQTMIFAHWVYGWTLGRSLGAVAGARRMFLDGI
ncbi:MAG TPA: DUF6789 family protein [Chloroflexota bacterium]